jgi:hypothetical protein
LDLPDRKGRPIEEVRATRDDIARCVKGLAAELDGQRMGPRGNACFLMHRKALAPCAVCCTREEDGARAWMPTASAMAWDLQPGGRHERPNDLLE